MDRWDDRLLGDRGPMPKSTACWGLGRSSGPCRETGLVSKQLRMSVGERARRDGLNPVEGQRKGACHLLMPPEFGHGVSSLLCRSLSGSPSELASRLLSDESSRDRCDGWGTYRVPQLAGIDRCVCASSDMLGCMQLQAHGTWHCLEEATSWCKFRDVVICCGAA